MSTITAPQETASSHPAPTCGSRYASGERCGRPAAAVIGLFRSCGCPDTPRAVVCQSCLNGGMNHHCRHCGARYVVTFSEPVRLRGAASDGRTE